MILAAAASSSTPTEMLFIFSLAAMILLIVVASWLYGLLGFVSSVMICVIVSVILMIRYGTS